jgi:ferrous iron transport protein A
MTPPRTSAETVLSQVAVGQTALVLGLHGGRAVGERLAEFGLVPSARVSVLRNSSHGPLLVAAQGARLALGRGEAAKVRVVVDLAKTGHE